MIYMYVLVEISCVQMAPEHLELDQEIRVKKGNMKHILVEVYCIQRLNNAQDVLEMSITSTVY